MGCGSPLGDLFYLADSLLYRSHDSSPPLERGGVGSESGEDLRSRLYRMYGDGLISEEVFDALRALADRGQLRSADLAVHLARARRGQTERGDPAVANALSGIRSRLARLLQARTISEKALADLDARLEDLDQRIAVKKQAARQIVAHDEAAARRHLSQKAELASSRQRLASQAQALREDLARLDDLRAQLAAKAAELEAVQARSQLNMEATE
jgi:chromosome segregation ATPase